MPKKIDPLNRKLYGAVTVMLCVTDVKAAASFYQKAFGFTKRGIMNGPDGKPMHAELRLRDTTLMLGPEDPERGARSAKTIGATPATLYLTSENVDRTVAKAIKLGAKQLQPVMDMFWGDRCGVIMDPEGNSWMVGTHIAEPTPQEMKKAMKEMAAAGPGASSDLELAVQPSLVDEGALRRTAAPGLPLGSQITAGDDAHERADQSAEATVPRRRSTAAGGRPGGRAGGRAWGEGPRCCHAAAIVVSGVDRAASTILPSILNVPPSKFCIANF